MKKLTLLVLILIAGIVIISGCTNLAGEAKRSRKPIPVCGNNILEAREQCDITDLGGQTCQSRGFENGGTLRCFSNCMFDTSNCVTPCIASTCEDCFKGRCDNRCDRRREGKECSDCNKVLECCGDGNCNSGEDEKNCPADCYEPPCVEAWSCSAWSKCYNYTKTRTCIDKNDCGTTENRPSTSQSCTIAEECTDTDGGINFYELGSVKDYIDGQYFPDYCTLNGLEVEACTNTGYNCGIIEKYCDINNRRSGRYLSGAAFDNECPYGCKDGACIAEVCDAKYKKVCDTDSDGDVDGTDIYDQSGM